MHDRILLDNYLLVLKSTVEVYVHGTLESSNRDIRQLLKSCLDDTMNHQANTYDKMVSYGWYQVNNVDSMIIDQTLNKVKNSN